MSTNSYQPNWAGVMNPQQQSTNTNYLNQNYSQGQGVSYAGSSPSMFNQPPQYPNIVIVPIQGEEAVHNYIVGRGVTAFLIDYTNRVFWKKRQTDDGLGYETVKHYFFTEDEYNADKIQNGGYVSLDEFNELKKTVSELSELLK